MDDGVLLSPRIGLRNQIRTLRRRKWSIIISVIVVVALSGVYDYLKTPEYVATAQLELTPQISTSLLEANNSSLLNSANPVDVPTASSVIESQKVANRVRKTIPNAPSVTVTPLGITDVVAVSVKSTDPHLAARAANAYAAAYFSIEQSQSVSALNSATNVLQNHINANQAAINSLQQQVNGLGSTNTSQLQSLITQITSLETTQQTLRQQASQYATAASLSTGGGQVITAANVPTTPSAPKPVEYAVLAVLVGLVVGVGIALLQERLDDKIRSAEDLEPTLHDVPLIGQIPPVTAWRDRSKPYTVTLQQPNSPASEAFRSLRTSIEFLALDRDFRTLLLTSPVATEGKTSTVANLAVAIAKAGKRVIVVDCDLRRPRLHKFFGLPNDVGFTSLLLGEVGLDEVVRDVAGQPNLKLLPSGRVPPNPSELLSGRRTQEVLSVLASQADVVLIDSPPIVPVTDAAVLAPRVDGILLVTSIGISTRRNLARAVQILRRVEAPLSGVVLNRSIDDDSYTYYNYAETYASPASASDDNGSTNGKRRYAHAGEVKRQGTQLPDQ